MDNMVGGGKEAARAELADLANLAKDVKQPSSRILILEGDGDGLVVAKRQSGVITSIKRLVVRIAGLFGKDKSALNERFGLDQDNKARTAATRFTELVKVLAEEGGDEARDKDPAYVSIKKFLASYKLIDLPPQNIDNPGNDEGRGELDHANEGKVELLVEVGNSPPDNRGPDDRRESVGEHEVEKPFARNEQFVAIPNNKGDALEDEVDINDFQNLPREIEEEINQLVEKHFEGFDVVDSPKVTEENRDNCKVELLTRAKTLDHMLQKGFVDRIRKLSLENYNRETVNFEDEGQAMGVALNSMNKYIENFSEDSRALAKRVCLKILVGSLGNGLEGEDLFKVVQNYAQMTSRKEKQGIWEEIRINFSAIHGLGYSHGVVLMALGELLGVENFALDDEEAYDPHLSGIGEQPLGDNEPQRPVHENKETNPNEFLEGLKEEINDLPMEIREEVIQLAEGSLGEVELIYENSPQLDGKVICDNTKTLMLELQNEFVARICKLSLGNYNRETIDLKEEGKALALAMNSINKYIDSFPAKNQDQAKRVCQKILLGSLKESLKDSEYLMVADNYEEMMIQDSQRPPWSLIRRSFVVNCEDGFCNGVVRKALGELIEVANAVANKQVLIEVDNAFVQGYLKNQEHIKDLLGITNKFESKNNLLKLFLQGKPHNDLELTSGDLDDDIDFIKDVLTTIVDNHSLEEDVGKLVEGVNEFRY